MGIGKFRSHIYVHGYDLNLHSLTTNLALTAVTTRLL